MANNGRKMESIKKEANGNPFNNRLAAIEQKSMNLNTRQQKPYRV